MTTTTDKEITITEAGQKTIMAMRDRLAQVRAAFGESSDEYGKMAGSLAFSLAQMLNLGGLIMREGELSLFCRNDWLVYGVNFSNAAHRDKEFPYNLLGDWSVNS